MVAFAARVVAIGVVGHEVDEAQAVSQLRLERPHAVAHAGIEAGIEAVEGENEGGRAGEGAGLGVVVGILVGPVFYPQRAGVLLVIKRERGVGAFEIDSVGAAAPYAKCHVGPGKNLEAVVAAGSVHEVERHLNKVGFGRGRNGIGERKTVVFGSTGTFQFRAFLGEKDGWLKGQLAPTEGNIGGAARLHAHNALHVIELLRRAAVGKRRDI